MTPVDKIPISPITARMIVCESYTVIFSLIDGRGTEAVYTDDLLRSCQATCVACLVDFGRSLRTQGCLGTRQDLMELKT